MKYCPYCGADLIEGTVSFCAECGKELPPARTNKKSNESEERQSHKNESVKKHMKTPVIPEPEHIEDGYDGYYNDIQPIDNGHRRDGIDKELVRKIVILLGCLFVIIAACVVLLYVL